MMINFRCVPQWKRGVTITAPASARHFSLISPEEHARRKDEYNKKVTDLRKQWTADYQQQQEKAKERKRKETQRAILQKAIRLRTKREDSEARNALKKLNNERADFFYREHLAKLKIIRSKKFEVQKKRFESLVQSLEAESKYWITPENMDSLITEELFTKPCSTGVVTKSSEFWRHYARCTNINRLLFGVLPNIKDEDTINDVILERTQAERATKEDIMGTLNSMIGTGEDRAKFDELVEDFSNFTGSVGGTNRKPVNYNSTPDFDKMKKSDFLNLFEKGENAYEDKLLHDKVDELMAGSHQDDASMEEEDSDGDDLHISENDYHMDEAFPPSSSKGVDKKSSSMEPIGSDYTTGDVSDDEDNFYATAEPSGIDEIIEDLEYVDETDVEALRGAYERLRTKMRNKSRY